MTEHESIDDLICAADSGDRAARDRLFASLYSELRQMARRALGRNPGNFVTLSATTLVHEVYAGLAERNKVSFPDRGRFMAYASRAMRSLIVDRARNRGAIKRGGEFQFTQLDSMIPESAPEGVELQKLSDALDDLSQRDHSLAEIVDLKYFCGLSLSEIAAIRGVSEKTVQRDWEKARLLLYSDLKPSME